MRYGSTTACRWKVLGNYFEEPLEDDCARCDNCLARAEGRFEARPPTRARPPIVHREYQSGVAAAPAA
ncbi:RecQ family zinc-binding domain-containing protein [Corallococcus sp. CA049B]|uniref:RecQ family zinc-binding domain-containing protein n=1 Tax=Corallococcus sp. CA049B TaxID=2316730 RepID=UPI001F424C11|nr:RecQ family zinc-binding domain-containing protein [Corallococcus sp. CA049B]